MYISDGLLCYKQMHIEWVSLHLRVFGKGLKQHIT